MLFLHLCLSLDIVEKRREMEYHQTEIMKQLHPSTTLYNPLPCLIHPFEMHLRDIMTNRVCIRSLFDNSLCANECVCCNRWEMRGLKSALPLLLSPFHSYPFQLYKVGGGYLWGESLKWKPFTNHAVEILCTIAEGIISGQMLEKKINNICVGSD